LLANLGAPESPSVAAVRRYLREFLRDPRVVEMSRPAGLLVQALDLPVDHGQPSFQSRLGPRQWLQPYTDHTLKALAAAGIKNVQVICPGFSADCLETLEEVSMENRDIFLAAGGEPDHCINLPLGAASWPRCAPGTALLQDVSAPHSR